MSGRIVVECLVSSVGGVVAPLVLIHVWGLFNGWVWSLAVRYMWTAHDIAIRGTLFTVLDTIAGVIVGAVVGVAFSYPLVRRRRSHSYLPLAMLIVAFVGSVIAFSPGAGPRDLLETFTTPVVVAFVVATSAMFRLGSRTKASVSAT